MEKRFVFVCQNVDCKSRGGNEVMARLGEGLNGNESLEVRPYMCFGACHEGPNVVIYPDKVWYANVTPQEISAVLDYVQNGASATHLDTIQPNLKEMIFQLLDAGLY